jgi:hypothetical protein
MSHANTPQHTVSGPEGSNRPPGMKFKTSIPNGLRVLFPPSLATG